MLLPLLIASLLAADPVSLQGETPTTTAPAASAALQRSPLVTLLLQAHGGQERVEALKGVRFELTQVTMPAPTEADPEPAPVSAEPVRFSIQYAGDGGRLVRLEQRAGESDLVRLASGGGASVWIDGEARSSAELGLEAQGMAAEMFVVLDLVWGMVNGQVVSEPSGRKRRDDVDYLTARVTFPPSRSVPSIYLLYVNPKTGLVDRADVFDEKSLRRMATISFGGYVALDGPQVPTQITFSDRDKRPLVRWELSGAEINPTWPEGHFERP
ncbi:hypothetical protein [Engelhardtia mirabilis]|uniref:Outer membrane lipoprotein-sorting protein n=1 Tax=Engelhardtia mirabilis TaxID=2528011 RepID=A0A518BQG3_9BACT|nr:hypothetical protein Pla133_43340 [Planctomycetes bacterium Pla133]QDV03544.1 hypothetical protein Pla86_43330 [Planctomycetes bacterium Pla86]